MTPEAVPLPSQLNHTASGRKFLLRVDETPPILFVFLRVSGMEHMLRARA